MEAEREAEREAESKVFGFWIAEAFTVEAHHFLPMHTSFSWFTPITNSWYTT